MKKRPNVKYRANFQGLLEQRLVMSASNPLVKSGLLAAEVRPWEARHAKVQSLLTVSAAAQGRDAAEDINRILMAGARPATAVA